MVFSQQRACLRGSRRLQAAGIASPGVKRPEQPLELARIQAGQRPQQLGLGENTLHVHPLSGAEPPATCLHTFRAVVYQSQQNLRPEKTWRSGIVLQEIGRTKKAGQDGGECVTQSVR